MNDLSYAEATGAEPAPVVLLGPVPCKGCGAWVEWAGVEWLALRTTERHSCLPYLGHPASLNTDAGDRLDPPPGWPPATVTSVRPGDKVWPYSPGSDVLPPYHMAHPEPAPLPRWVRMLGAGIVAFAAVMAWLFVAELILRSRA